VYYDDPEKTPEDKTRFVCFLFLSYISNHLVLPFRWAVGVMEEDLGNDQILHCGFHGLNDIFNRYMLVQRNAY